MARTIINPARFNNDGNLGGRNWVRVSFFDEGYGVSDRLSDYRRGGPIVPNTAAFSGIGLNTPSSPLKLSQFSGLFIPSLVTFFPEGGATVGAAVFVQSDVAYEEAEVIISCTQNATWNYTKTLTSGLGTEFVNITTGSVATEIIFRFDSTFGQNSRRTYSLNATSGGITQYWTIDLRSDYS
jgi:hypothetical protein